MFQKMVTKNLLTENQCTVSSASTLYICQNTCDKGKKDNTCPDNSEMKKNKDSVCVTGNKTNLFYDNFYKVYGGPFVDETKPGENYTIHDFTPADNSTGGETGQYCNSSTCSEDSEDCATCVSSLFNPNNCPNCANLETCKENLLAHYNIRPNKNNSSVLKVGNLSLPQDNYNVNGNKFQLYGGNTNGINNKYESVSIPPVDKDNHIDIKAYIEALSDPDYITPDKPLYKKYGGNGIPILKNIKPCPLYVIWNSNNYIINTCKVANSNRYAANGYKGWGICDNYINFQYGYIKANESVLFGYNGYGILLKEYFGWNHEDNENLTNDILLLNSLAFNTKKNKKHITIPTIFVLTIIALFMAICVSFVLYNRGKISKQKLVFYIILFISISILNLYIFNSFPSEVEEKNKNLGVWEDLLNTNVEDTQRHIPNSSVDFYTNNMEKNTYPKVDSSGNPIGDQIGSGWAYSHYNFFDPIISSINGYHYTTYKLPDLNQTHKNTDYLSYIVGNQSKDSQYSNPSIIEYLDSITDSSNQVSNLNGLVPSIIDKITITGGQTTQNTYIVNNFRDRTLAYDP